MSYLERETEVLMEKTRHHFAILDSTNNCGKRNAHLFDPEKLTIITANEQTSGRGRGKRSWVSPAHENIYATFCFFVPRNRNDLGNLAQLLSLSSSIVLEELGVTPSLKWPNDIMVNDKKIGGTLCEAKIVEDKICMLNGIGINVNMSRENLDTIDQPATSLMIETGHPFDIEKVLSKLEERTTLDLQEFLSRGFTSFLPKYKKMIGNDLHKTIRFHDNAQVWEGVFHSINDDGSLNLLLPSRQMKRFHAGQIVA